MESKSFNGARNIISIVYLLAHSPVPLTLYQIAKYLGLSRSSVKSALDLLLSEGHVIKTDDGRYTVSPDYVYVYNGVAIYKATPDHYLILMPDYGDMSDEELVKTLLEIKKNLPASVRLWIEMPPRKFLSK